MGTNPKDEILALLCESAEHARYLGELGVETVAIMGGAVILAVALAFGLRWIGVLP